MAEGSNFRGGSSAGLERLPVTQKVAGSSPVHPANSLPGSSVAEQVTVNHLVVGSTPTRAAISIIVRTYDSNR